MISLEICSQEPYDFNRRRFRYRTYKGQEISKAIAKANQPGGLTYSANKIGLSTFQLLKALEGMCADGRVTCVDDSTYYVGEF